MTGDPRLDVWRQPARDGGRPTELDECLSRLLDRVKRIGLLFKQLFPRKDRFPSVIAECAEGRLIGLRCFVPKPHWSSAADEQLLAFAAGDNVAPRAAADRLTEVVEAMALERAARGSSRR